MERSPGQVYGKKIIAKDSTAKNKPTGKKNASARVYKQIADDEVKEQMDIDLAKLLKKTPKNAFYKQLEPMLVTLTDQPFDNDAWLYEAKWDG